MTPQAAYGYRAGDERMILVHVVAPGGWHAYGSAWAMCGAGLDREAGWPSEGQKWCRRCTDEQYRFVTDTHIFPAGYFAPGQA